MLRNIYKRYKHLEPGQRDHFPKNVIPRYTLGNLNAVLHDTTTINQCDCIYTLAIQMFKNRAAATPSQQVAVEAPHSIIRVLVLQRMGIETLLGLHIEGAMGVEFFRGS